MWSLPNLTAWRKNDKAASLPDQPENDIKPSRRAVPSLQREITFQRRQSERRDNLAPNDPDLDDRRALSADRVSRTAPGHGQLRATSSVPSEHMYHTSSIDPLPLIDTSLEQARKLLQDPANIEETLHAGIQFDTRSQYPSELPSDLEDISNASEDAHVQEELEYKWVLNLSMHFRDKSDREKFFITYLENPSLWRRLTVSCDYRSCPPESLEADLRSLHYQRDKSGEIYKAIRDSLPEIKFLQTVTNLKLQTDDGRLHVHVTEDANEIIPFPAVSLLPYLDCPHYPESEVYFHSHESGFVYDVVINGSHYVKKEIPGPEAVEEFLYEINALSSLRHSPHVIPFEGLVVDEHDELIKGLVLGFASNGALVDIIYDSKELGSIPWARRLKWATQVVNGLADIHEAGFVQGDFTLSNIVIDSADDARVIDINRRGCPVGWEPPELAKMIEAGQKISIYIGAKTDMYQLGMVLWALAEEHDEPERVMRPLKAKEWDGVPKWYVDAFESCYAATPQERPSAKEVLKLFLDGQRETGAAVEAPLLPSDHAVGIQPDDEPLVDRRDCEPLSSSSDSRIPTSGVGRQEISHPASWHVPPHQDSGFDEQRGQADSEVNECAADRRDLS